MSRFSVTSDGEINALTPQLAQAQSLERIAKLKHDLANNMMLNVNRHLSSFYPDADSCEKTKLRFLANPGAPTELLCRRDWEALVLAEVPNVQLRLRSAGWVMFVDGKDLNASVLITASNNLKELIRSDES